MRSLRTNLVPHVERKKNHLGLGLRTSTDETTLGWGRDVLRLGLSYTGVSTLSSLPDPDSPRGSTLPNTRMYEKTTTPSFLLFHPDGPRRSYARDEEEGIT